MQTVLVVEDEPDIRELLCLNLKRNGYDCLTASDGIVGLKIAREERPDLILLDLMLPGKDGLSVFKELRADPRTQSIPVLMLTAKGDVNDRILGLELGADDYVGKPFSPRELMLRVRAVFKRTKRVAVDARLVLGPFDLDRNALKLFLEGKSVELTATEFKLLRLLVEARGGPVEREVLLREVWGYADTTMSRTLDTHIKRLREKLGKYENTIRTVRTIGYTFVWEEA